MKVVIFGSTGQLGYAVVDYFSKRRSSYEVTSVKRETSPIAFPTNTSTVVVKCLDRVSFASSMRNMDHVIYAIGSPEQWVNNQDYFHRTNVELLREFLEAIKGFPNTSVTYVSTYEVFSAKNGVCSESNGFVAKGPTPYYQSMIDALAMVRKHAAEHGTKIIYIHPAALYGGLNTGLGITHFLLNLKTRNYLGSPAMLPGRFPLVHVESLASAMDAAIQKECFGEGFNISDIYLSLKDLSLAANRVCPAVFRPLELPVWLVRISSYLMDWVAHAITRRPPILSSVQVLYITKSSDMDCAKARAVLGWSPMPLEDGIRKLFSNPLHFGS